ncbi:hypothetical protein [Pontibacter liquoris]|uniref:hypothetical protein n=1 Tax=Pontibacter liquoris TaxID=2905677 RepID=UPI001FA7428D|nr:hypothetical protein [Pontibacter liquoris]
MQALDTRHQFWIRKDKEQLTENSLGGGELHRQTLARTGRDLSSTKSKQKRLSER